MKDNPNHKIMGSVWFSVPDGEVIGIVLMHNGYEYKSYIAHGRGFDQTEDEEYIATWGSPFPLEQAMQLIGGRI
jgi:hypothetical protein